MKIRKKDKVVWKNNYGIFEGVVKTIIPNPNGEPQVVIMIGDPRTKQFITQSLSNIHKKQA